MTGQPREESGEALAAFAANALGRPLPEDVAEKAKLHIIDTLAAIVSGAVLEAGRAGQRYAVTTGGAVQATVLGTRIRAPLIEAVLANGMAAHADESDDSHEDSQTHPGCAVLPAAVGVAESLGATGREFLNAVNLGYEMTIRFGEALVPGMSFARSSLSCHAYGPLFGSGYTAGALMRFDADQFRILLNYLAQEASGLTTWWLDDAHTLKSYVFAAMPASNGVKAAALVRSGFTGRGDVLDPRGRNMLDAISPNTNRGALFDGLGTRHRILETDIKKYPVGFPIAAPIAALESLISEHRLTSEKVEAIRVRYDEDWYRVVGDGSRMPDVNLRYCLAVTMLDGRMTYEAAHDASRMSKPDVLALGNRIEFLGPQAGQDRFAVQIEVIAGARILSAEQGRSVSGRAENPMSKQEIHEKALEFMGTAVPLDSARRAIELVDAIEAAPDIRALVKLLSDPL